VEVGTGSKPSSDDFGQVIPAFATPNDCSADFPAVHTDQLNYSFRPTADFKAASLKPESWDSLWF